ncbi:unnamed protein product, partial [Rotaria sp. Silwood2]
MGSFILTHFAVVLKAKLFPDNVVVMMF